MDGYNIGDTCYTVDMTDTHGDGWNGGAIEVYEDGVMVDSLTLATGNPFRRTLGTEDSI